MKGKKEIFTVITNSGKKMIEAHGESEAMEIARNLFGDAAVAWLSFGIVGMDYNKEDITTLESDNTNTI